MGIKYVGIALLGIMTLGAITPAQAATSYTRSLKYFSESGQVVGQQIIYCNNVTKRGGNINTAYHITEVNVCTPAAPAPTVIVPGTQVTAYTLPAFLTISAACGLAQCISSGMYPDEMTGVSWTWSNGWQ